MKTDSSLWNVFELKMLIKYDIFLRICNLTTKAFNDVTETIIKLNLFAEFGFCFSKFFNILFEIPPFYAVFD